MEGPPPPSLLIFPTPTFFSYSFGKQGFVFWEQTPASSMKLQPAAFPMSLQRLAQNNSRILQRVVWAVAKVRFFKRTISQNAFRHEIL